MSAIVNRLKTISEWWFAATGVAGGALGFVLFSSPAPQDTAPAPQQSTFRAAATATTRPAASSLAPAASAPVAQAALPSATPPAAEPAPPTPSATAAAEYNKPYQYAEQISFTFNSDIQNWFQSLASSGAVVSNCNLYYHLAPRMMTTQPGVSCDNYIESASRAMRHNVANAYVNNLNAIQAGGDSTERTETKATFTLEATVDGVKKPIRIRCTSQNLSTGFSCQQIPIPL